MFREPLSSFLNLRGTTWLSVRYVYLENRNSFFFVWNVVLSFLSGLKAGDLGRRTESGGLIYIYIYMAAWCQNPRFISNYYFINNLLLFFFYSILDECSVFVLETLNPVVLGKSKRKIALRFCAEVSLETFGRPKEKGKEKVILIK